MLHCSIPVRVALCCMFSSMEWHSHLYCCCLVFHHQTACPKLITLSPAFDRPGLAHPGRFILSAPWAMTCWTFMNIHELCWRHMETPMYPASNAPRTGRPGSGQAMTGQWQWCGNGCKFPRLSPLYCLLAMLWIAMIWLQYFDIFWLDCSVMFSRYRVGCSVGARVSVCSVQFRFAAVQSV